MNVITSHFGDFLSGFGVTLALTVIGFVGALVLGTIVCVCRVVPIRPLQVIGAVYVEFFRNIPLLSLLILVVFGLPDIGVSYSLFTSAAISLVLSAAPFVCEAIRGGINAVPTGQAEAARAIGLSFTRVLRHVVLPQAFRTMVQPLTNIFIGVALSSSLAAAVGVAELTNQTEQLTLKYADAVACFLTSGVFYLVLAFAGAGAGGWLDRRVAIKR